MTMALSFVLSSTKETTYEQELADSGEPIEVVRFRREKLSEMLASGAKAVLVLPTPEAYCWERFNAAFEEPDRSVDRWLIGFHAVRDLKREFARQVECVWLEEYLRIRSEHGGNSTFLKALIEQGARSASHESQVALIDQIAWRLISDQLKSLRRYQEICTAKALYFKECGPSSLGDSIVEHLRGLAQIAEEHSEYDASKVAAAKAETRLQLATETEIRLNDEITKCRKELSETRNELEQQRKMLAAERNKSHTAARDLEQAQTRADEADTKLQRIREERNGLVEAVEDIYASNSWKLTAPMRAFLKGVRRHDSK